MMGRPRICVRFVSVALVVGFSVAISGWGDVTLQRSRAYARDLGSRLGGSASTATVMVHETPAVAPATPAQELILWQSLPMAADGVGRLLLLESIGDGYMVIGRQSGQFTASDDFEMIYRRKGVWATSLAVGPDGSFCIGLLSGVDCVNSQGIVTHVVHEQLSHVISIAFTPDGDLWALTSTSGGTTGLHLVHATKDFSHISRVLTMRQDVRGFMGNGLAAAMDGSAIVPVIENDTYRLLRVEPTGRFARIGDFFHLGGGVVTDAYGFAIADGIKRPQSAEEQKNPQDVLFVLPVSGSADHGPGHGAGQTAAQQFAATFPLVQGGTRLTGHMTLGGDGSLYVTRHERVRVDSGRAREMPVLWRIDLDRPSIIGPDARIIDFRIPYIDSVSNPRISPLDYVGPLLIGREQPLVIRGANFTGKDGLASVVVGDSFAPIESWTEDLIVVTIPQDAAGGDALVEVAIDHVRSNSEWIQVKTPEISGWFQIGTPQTRGTLSNNLAIIGYNAQITIEGTTDRGEHIHRLDMMETPGLFHTRLPNGTYHATFSAAYVFMNVQYDTGGEYAGSSHTPVKVPTQTFAFHISDVEPVALWVPDMFSREAEREAPWNDQP